MSDKEPGHVDANLEKTPPSALLPNVSLTRFGELPLFVYTVNNRVLAI